jgi:hypothetical protein
MEVSAMIALPAPDARRAGRHDTLPTRSVVWGAGCRTGLSEELTGMGDEIIVDLGAEFTVKHGLNGVMPGNGALPVRAVATCGERRRGKADPKKDLRR